ncbi:IclR family transcriptional regulator [Aurantiacibacter poecillastricola]|uniref:IclR family transcriptional regulator n=1 Tax=Aurantiacibacter poecillastricola TaxID=3064385 RepID=UPI00273DFD0A|nr:IclR family transcriptional regulator [Aurantiacibacter sp. 219JJ12-13]MDP5260083.1 IclR family transcriptional regulator [Aurantiacibacter sp. 219JJ12-13]
MADAETKTPAARQAAAAPAQNSQVKSATRTLDIIEYVVAHNRPLVAQEIATALGIPVSSLSYLLATLVERDYLERQGRRYSAGPGLARLQTSGHTYTLADRAAPLVRTLRMQLDETTSFFIREGWEIEAIVTESSEQALRYSVPTGQRLPMHALAAGKVLLAALSDEDLDRYFAETERNSFTPFTVTDEAALREQIAVSRESGFATTSEEFSRGIEGIARVVLIDGNPVGSISVAMPKVRVDDRTEAHVREMLRKTAALLES